jgi:uncharacterized protein (TIGR00369 family)
MSNETPFDSLDVLNQHLGGFNKTMGLKFTKASKDEVVAELAVGDVHLQPYGIVHGGVHAAIIETACSTGAAINAFERGQSVVGLENSTSFIRAARGGKLIVTATPITRGRRSQVWEGKVTGDDGKLLATGRVRLMALEADANLAGEKVSM